MAFVLAATSATLNLCIFIITFPYNCAMCTGQAPGEMNCGKPMLVSMIIMIVFATLGSVVELETADSRYDGIYTVLDTGPAVQGATVDLYMWSCHEALKFGRRPVALTVLRLGWNPRATAGSFVDRLFGRAAVAADSTLPSRPLPLAP